MTDIFFGIVTVIFCLFLFDIKDRDIETNLNEYKGSVFIDYKTSVMYGKNVNLLMPNREIEMVLIYDIAIKDLNIGDTIK